MKFLHKRAAQGAALPLSYFGTVYTNFTQVNPAPRNMKIERDYNLYFFLELFYFHSNEERGRKKRYKKAQQLFIRQAERIRREPEKTAKRRTRSEWSWYSHVPPICTALSALSEPLKNPNLFTWHTVLPTKRNVHLRFGFFKGSDNRKTAVQDSIPIRRRIYFPNRSLCVPVRASVSTSTSSSMR